VVLFDIEADAGVAATTALIKPIAHMSSCIERERKEAWVRTMRAWLRSLGFMSETLPKPASRRRDCTLRTLHTQ
jgi:hypothetical protein